MLRGFSLDLRRAACLAGLRFMWKCEGGCRDLGLLAFIHAVPCCCCCGDGKCSTAHLALDRCWGWALAAHDGRVCHPTEVWVWLEGCRWHSAGVSVGLVFPPCLSSAVWSQI